MKTKQILFYRAHLIAKSAKVNFSQALRQAWAVLKLAKEMKEKVVEFAYKKVDGSIRFAKGTLKIDQPENEQSKRTFNTKVQTYFDLEVQEFRCFKVENLIF